MTSIISMVNLTELDGVAEGRAENLQEAGYESVEDLVDADAGEVADEVSYLPEDTALELIVQAQNIVAEEEAEVEESQPVTKEVADAVDSADEPEAEEPEPEESITVEESEDESDTADETDESVDESPEAEAEPEPEEEGPELIAFELTFEEALEYDTFFDAVMSQRATVRRTNRDGAEAFTHVLDQMRGTGVGDTVELELEESELNGLHNSVREMTVSYKGDNLIDHMDALKRVLSRINDVRSEHLF